MATTLVSLDQRSIEMVIALQRYAGEPFESVIARALKEALGDRAQAKPKRQSGPPEEARLTRFRIMLLGETCEVATAREVLITVLQRLDELDGQFLSKLSRETGRTRRIVASTPEAIYPGRPDLAKYTYPLTSNYWVGTNYSKHDIDRIIRLACSVAGVDFGTDLVVTGPGWPSTPADGSNRTQRSASPRGDGVMKVAPGMPDARVRH